MNLQETQSLETLLSQLVQVCGIAKDPQADSLIASAVAQQPDAAYLLVQRALLMEQALNQAKAQIASLQGQLEAAQAPQRRSFLDAEAWGNTGASAPRTMASPSIPPGYSQSAPVQSPAPAPSPGLFGSGLGGTLGTVAATAAGVAGGAFLFQGIEHMLHAGGGNGLMNQSGVGAFAPPVENTTVNNFYDGDSARTSGSFLDFLASDDTNWDDGSSAG